MRPILPPIQRDVVAPLRRAATPTTIGPPAPGAEEEDRGQALVDAMGRALAEVLVGRRPTAQLSRWVAAASLGRLTAAVRVGAWRKVTVSSTRASRADGGDVWGRITLDCDGRPLIAALRLRQEAQRWRCLRVDLLLPGAHLCAEV